MKYVLLSALSLMLISNSSALADDDRKSAGAASPVKLGGETRTVTRTTKTTVVPAKVEAPGSTVVKSVTTSSTSTTTTTAENAPVKKTASIRGLIPPPPDVMVGTGLTLKKKKKKTTTTTTVVEKTVVIGSGGPFTFTGKSQETFSTLFNWQPSDKNDTLTFRANFSPIAQGGSAGTHFNWLRIMLGDRVLGTEQTLKNKTSLVLDFTGQVNPGENQIVIKGQGSNGATVDWKLTTPRKPKLTSLTPDEVVVGEELKLTGENFDTNPANDIVTLDKKTVVASSATAKLLKVKIPKNFEPGEYKVKVTIDGLSTQELKVTVRGIPELTNTNLQGVPPGAQLVIFGKNFSKKMSENKVLFNSTPAEVVSSTTETITVVVPNFYTGLEQDTAGVAGQVGIPIRVKVGKIEAKNTVPINVGNSTWQDPGMKGGPDVPQVPVDWRQLFQ